MTSSVVVTLEVSPAIAVMVRSIADVVSMFEVTRVWLNVVAPASTASVWVKV